MTTETLTPETSTTIGLIAHVLPASLKSALAHIANVDGSKTPLPIMANVLITADPESGEVELTGGDLETFLQYRIVANVERGGSGTLPLKVLRDWVDRAKGDGRLTMAWDEATATMALSIGRSKFDAKGITADEYPPVHVGVDTDLFSIISENLSRALAFTMPALCAEGHRHALTCVQIDQTAIGAVSFAAADGYRLHVATSEVEQSSEALMPALMLGKAALKALAKLVAKAKDTLTFHVDTSGSSSDHRVTVSGYNWTLTHVMFDGKFPPFRSVIPASQSQALTVDADALKTAAREAEFTARDSAYACRITTDELPDGAGGTVVTVTGKSQERGVSSGALDATSATGRAWDVSVDVKYLIAAASLFDGAIVVEGKGAANPLTMRSMTYDAGFDRLAMVMPMAIRK